MKSVLIYSDHGSSEFCLKQLFSCLRQTYSDKQLKIEFINADYIKTGLLSSNNDGNLGSKTLCFGGGFDLGYLSSLSQIGCEEIKKFVSKGGNYLGICAGAYFACDFIEFDLNGPLEVKGERPLGFFAGKAIGPINKLFKYNNDDFVNAIGIQLDNGSQFKCYLNGGPYFTPYTTSDCEVIAKYRVSKECTNLLDCNDKIAVFECKVGKGKCLLSGVHFEIDPNELNLSNENIRTNVYPGMIAEGGDRILAKYLLDKVV